MKDNYFEYSEPTIDKYWSIWKLDIFLMNEKINIKESKKKDVIQFKLRSFSEPSGFSDPSSESKWQ